MVKTYIPFLAFLALLLLTIPFPFATSVVPGWHVTVLPPLFIWTSILAIVFIFVAIGYWLLNQHAKPISWTFFIIHLLLTLPAVIFIKLPTIFLEFDTTNQEILLHRLSIRMAFIPWAWVLFTIGQIIFLVSFVRIIITKRNNQSL